MADGSWVGVDLHARSAMAGVLRARHRLSKLLLRHGLLWQRSARTREHERWLAGLRFDGPLAICFDESYDGVLQAKARRDRLDRAIAELAATPASADVVARLCCLRGVSTLTALALTVELGDWQRFDPARLGAFLGLVPSEQSSGEQRRQGPITKTGNSHARRPLVEAAWHQRRALRRASPSAAAAPVSQQPSRQRRGRGPSTPPRWWDLERRGKRRTIVAVAVARELAGHCWKLATME